MRIEIYRRAHGDKFPSAGTVFFLPTKVRFPPQENTSPTEVGGFVFGQKKGPDWIPAGALAYEWEWRLLASRLEATTLSDFVSDRRSDEERAVRTEDDTQEDGEGEATHRSTAEGEDDQHHE